MGLNPFKDSNLDDLQNNVSGFLRDHFGDLYYRIKESISLCVNKGRERITIMLIPHSEKKIGSFHIRIYTILLLICIIITTITITSVIVINHASTIKGVSKLKMYGKNSKIQIEKYKEEINKLYTQFQRFKPEITYLYSLTHAKDANSLWAKGSGGVVKAVDVAGQGVVPPMEILNVEEMEQELKTINIVLDKIKSFMDRQKKIIENTPSIWPVEGYIIQKYGMGSSPYSTNAHFKKGLEIATFPGSEIMATAPGKVESIRWNSKHGLSISIKHKYGYTTHYSHCQRITVSADQKVSKGDVIGYTGKTGKAKRHLCFYQIKIGTVFVNPLPYLNKLAR
ncbi:MAG: peptidoglycan DD-metalloendopeptidase family protein [Spirochaetota bacterium]|nr:peptidoglycan DD-metalloendopeptidase family protein [Spirochaetota bacterium]